MRNSSHDAVSNLDTILTLPWQTSVMALASSCREAALVFMNDAHHWGKAELAMWLIGPYAQILRFTSVLADRRAAGAEAAGAPENDRIGQIDARLVDRIIDNARAEVIATLESLSSEDAGASFAFTMIANGDVVHCTDRGGGAGWAPSGKARRLADRVLSLFAADYLTRPAAGEELSVCAVCEQVHFDRDAKGRGSCVRHHSTVVSPITRRNTLPYFPDSG